MTVVKAGIRRTVRADADQVPRLRHAVQAFVEAYCAGNNDLGSTVALAVTEACTNVVRHAYPAGDGEIELTASAKKMPVSRFSAPAPGPTGMTT